MFKKACLLTHTLPSRLLHPPALSLPGQPLRLRRALPQARPQRTIVWQGVAGIIPTARTVLPRPHSGTPRRAICQGEDLSISYAFLGGSGRSRPLLRASDAHHFIVRVMRAQRMVWLLTVLLGSSRALRKQGDRFSYPRSSFSILSEW